MLHGVAYVSRVLDVAAEVPEVAGSDRDLSERIAGHNAIRCICIMQLNQRTMLLIFIPL